MPSVSPVGPEDKQRYADILEEVASRLEAVKDLLAAGDAGLANIELSALHLRKIIELVVMGSLVTNRTEIEALAKALQRKKVREAQELAKAANPDYWPKGTRPFAGTSGPVEIQAVEGAWREDEWSTVYGHLSELLHARNPYKKPIDMPKERTWQCETRDKVIKLLEHHLVTLVNRDHMLVGRLLFDAKEVEVVTLERLPSSG